MANENELEIIIRAVDAATAELQKVQSAVGRFSNTGAAAMGQFSQANHQAADSLRRMREAGDQVAPSSLQMGRAIADSNNALFTFNQTSEETKKQTNKVEREWKKLTSSSEFVAQGIQTLRSAMTSILWGGLIGGAIAAAQAVLSYAAAARDAAIDANDLNKTVLDQAEKLGLISKARVELTRTTIDLYNAELELAQLNALDQSGKRQERIQDIKEENEALRDSITEWQARLDIAQKGTTGEQMAALQIQAKRKQILKNEVAIRKLNQEELQAIEILKMKQVTLEEAAEKMGVLTQAELAQESEGRNIQAAAVKAYNDRRAAQEALGRAILDAALLQQRDHAATQEALGQSIQMAAVLNQQRLAEERLLEVEKLRSTTVVDPTKALFETMQQNLAGVEAFRLQQEALNGAFGETPQRIAEMNLEMERSIQISQVAGQAVGTVINAITQMGIAGQFSGKMFAAAMLGFVAQTLASLSVMATTKAVESIAWAQYAQGLALLGHPGAAAAATQFYASAAFWGKVAVGAGVGAVATGVAAGRLSASAQGGGGSGGGGAASVTPGSLRGPDQTQGQTIEIYPTVNALNPETVDWDAVWQAAGDSFGRYLQRGGRTGNVQINFKRN